MTNSAALRKAKENMYSNMVQHVVRAIAPFLGLPVNSILLGQIHKATKKLVDSGRNKAQSIAYQDYSKFVDGKDLIPKLPLRRFTDELWQGSLEKVTKDTVHITEDVAAEIGLRADYWGRDAEWGQRIDSAKRDDRIGKVARVDFDPPTCPFCTLLNSRGPVYVSPESGSRTLHVGDTCTLVFVAKGSTEYPGKEFSDKALTLYKEARARAGDDPSTSKILAEMKVPGSTDKPGRVKANAKASAASANASALSDAQARVRALNSITPKSESAKTYQAAQLAKNQKLIEQLTRSQKDTPNG
jgi:hypothetical protein